MSGPPALCNPYFYTIERSTKADFQVAPMCKDKETLVKKSQVFSLKESCLPVRRPCSTL